MQSKKDLAERLKSRRQNIVTPVPPTKTLLFTPTFTADCGDKKPNSQAMSRQSSSQPVLQIVPDEVEAKKVVGDVPIVAPSPIDEIAQALNTKASDDELRDSSDSEESEDEEFEPVAEPDLPNLSLEQIEEYKRIRSREEISRRRAEKRGPDDFVLDEAERSDDDEEAHLDDDRFGLTDEDVRLDLEINAADTVRDNDATAARVARLYNKQISQDDKKAISGIEANFVEGKWRLEQAKRQARHAREQGGFGWDGEIDDDNYLRRMRSKFAGDESMIQELEWAAADNGDDQGALPDDDLMADGEASRQQFTRRREKMLFLEQNEKSRPSVFEEDSTTQPILMMIASSSNLIRSQSQSNVLRKEENRVNQPSQPSGSMFAKPQSQSQAHSQVIPPQMSSGQAAKLEVTPVKKPTSHGSFLGRMATKKLSSQLQQNMSPPRGKNIMNIMKKRKISSDVVH